MDLCGSFGSFRTFRYIRSSLFNDVAVAISGLLPSAIYRVAALGIIGFCLFEWIAIPILYRLSIFMSSLLISLSFYSASLSAIPAYAVFIQSFLLSTTMLTSGARPFSSASGPQLVFESDPLRYQRPDEKEPRGIRSTRANPPVYVGT